MVEAAGILGSVLNPRPAGHRAGGAMFATALLPLQSNPLHVGSLPAALDANDHLDGRC
jgi:hypothetical protein